MTGKEDAMRTNYMMTVDDVVERFHVPTGKQNFMDALREQCEGGFKMSATRTKHREPGM